MNDVVFVSGSFGWSFLEYLPTGAVQTTTISKSGKSVHSRHSMIGNDMVPSQYYGACSVRK
mgnify:CR=1 FL=1